MLHHVAQRASYHPATLAWHSHFLNILANRRHATPSDASSAGVWRPILLPYVPVGPASALRFNYYQEHEWTPSVKILSQQLTRRTKTGTATIRDPVPTFLTNSRTSAEPGDRDDSPMSAAYHIALGAKHSN